MSADDGFAIRDLLNAEETNGWWFWNPGTFVVVFISRYSGAQHAQACREALKELSSTRPSLSGLEIGTAEGPVVGVFSKAGIMESMPLGSVVSDAMKRAMHAS